MPDPAGSPDRRARRPVRPVRDEHPRRDRAGVRRLPAHRFRWLAVGRRWARARRGPRAIRAHPERLGRAARMTAPVVTLTFDNGPTPGITEPVLDLLAAAPSSRRRSLRSVESWQRPPGTALGRRIVERGHNSAVTRGAIPSSSALADDDVVSDELRDDSRCGRRGRWRRPLFRPVRCRRRDRRAADELARRLRRLLALRVHLRAVERAARRLAATRPVGSSTR